MIIETRRSNLVFHFDPRDGDIRERVSDVVPSVVGSPIWGKAKQGFGIRGVGTGYLEWAANAAWDVTDTATFVVQFLPCTISGLGNIFLAGRASSVTAARNGFFFSANGGNLALSLADADGSDSIGFSGGVNPNRAEEAVVLAAYWNSGGNAQLFHDGDRNTSQAYTNIPSPSGQVFRVGGYDTRFCPFPILGVYLFNALLSEKEITQFSEELATQGRAPRRGVYVRPQATNVANSAVNMAIVQRHGRLIPNVADASKNGVCSGNVGIVDRAGFVFDGSSAAINFGDVTSLNSANAWTLEAVVTHLAASGGGSGIISKTTSTNSRIALEISNASNPAGVRAAVKNGSDTYGDVANVVRFGHPMHIAAVYDGAGSANADRLKIYVDGESQTVAFTGTIPATGPSLAGTQLLVGDVVIGAGHQYENGIIERVCAHSRALTGAQIKERFLEWARCPVVDKGGPGRWILASGGIDAAMADQLWIYESSAAVTEVVTQGQRAFNGSGSTAQARSRSMTAFGSWMVLMSSNGGNTCAFDLIRSGLTRATDTGYSIEITAGGTLQLSRFGGTSLLSGGTLATDGSPYWVWVSRKRSGRFDVWYRAATSNTWLSVGNATDTTTNTSQWISFLLGLNSRFGRRVRVFPGPLVPGDVPLVAMST